MPTGVGDARGHPRKEATVTKKEIQDLKARLTVATAAVDLLQALARLGEILARITGHQ